MVAPSPEFLAQSRVPQIIAGNAVVQIIGTLFFLTRSYTRLFIIRSWKSEDYVLTVGWLAAMGYSICQYGEVSQGAGRHLAFNSITGTTSPVTLQKYSYAAFPFLFIALIFTKLSIGLSYIRIFYHDVLGRRLVQGTMVLLVLSNVANIGEVMLACNPIQVYWTELRPASKCITTQIPLYVNGTINVLVDIGLIATVLPRVLKLKLNNRQRYVLVGIVSIGWIAVAAGILRLVRVGMTLGKPGGIVDAPWDTYDISIWSSSEIYVGLVCAAAPGIKPLVSKILPKILGSTTKSRSQSRSQTWTADANPGSIELSLKKMRRGTIGSVTTNRSTNDAKSTGPYIEVSRGVDVDLLDDDDDGKEESGIIPGGGGDAGIHMTSETTVPTTTTAAARR
ncbi:hypothetical protein K504DRAFT_265654 [Pleomassaria siparia CBS 279.74]|uniref:Rhodopsin domain-containing protein n=1 Tax=Pleomassaria siparia CBS 279.74 TaxID=1314801 RepID=A0A6G1KCM6_9PLEO|nr:hypothetical protein K504DRAFT_265654 [Pleomassaria siparia CBS 279.74]